VLCECVEQRGAPVGEQAQARDTLAESHRASKSIAAEIARDLSKMP
jgi:hypothetical protein